MTPKFRTNNSVLLSIVNHKVIDPFLRIKYICVLSLEGGKDIFFPKRRYKIATALYVVIHTITVTVDILQKSLSRWLGNQHRAQWQGLGDTQRQARELISGPSLGSRAKFMTFNKFQSRAVTGLLTGHNTLRRHLHLLWLHGSPLCRKCGAKEETWAHILCECEALASLRHVHQGSFFLEPENIRRIGLGAIWTYSRATGLP